MRIVEFRIIIPLTLDEFVRGGLWVHHRVAHLEVSNGEAVELVCDKWTEHEQWGRGRHTERKYHIGEHKRNICVYVYMNKAVKSFNS